MLTFDQLIASAKAIEPSASVESAEDALRVLLGHGVADESLGDLSSDPRAYDRVSNWILAQNDQGFSEAIGYGSDIDAIEGMRLREDEFGGAES